MKVRIVHSTQYQFGSDVFLEPHYLRFKPKNTSYNALSSFSLEVTPRPAGFTDNYDEEGNHVNFCWFENTTNIFKIDSFSEIEIGDYNPFDFLIYPAHYQELPFEYAVHKKELLNPSLAVAQMDTSLRAYASEVLKGVNNSLQFVINLTHKIHSDFDVIHRMEGPPHEPNETFRLKKGSCRDLAWMQINLLRNEGIAAKFVSGYYFFPTETPVFELHAWLEVFFPGAGWIGFDPSHGIATGSSHIPVASSAYPAYTLPVSGSFRGDSSSHLKTDVHIEML